MSTGLETTRMTASLLSGFIEEKIDCNMARFRDSSESLSSPDRQYIVSTIEFTLDTSVEQ